MPLGVMWTSAHSFGEVIQAAREIAQSGAANLHAREAPFLAIQGRECLDFSSQAAAR